MDGEGSVYRSVESGIGGTFQELVDRFNRGDPPVCARRALYDAGIGVIEKIPEECVDCPLRDIYPGRPVLTACLTHDKKIYGLISVSLPVGTVFDREEQELFLELVGDVSFALHDLALEEELLTFRKMESLGAMAGGIAHDFNNMLTTISGNLALLKMPPGKGRPQQEIINDMEKACLRAQDLTRQLVTFARGGPSRKKPLRIEKICRDSVDLALHGTNVRCRYRIAPDLRPVEADRGQIGQVLNNLAINAVQALARSGRIELRAENVRLSRGEDTSLPTGRYVKVELEDEGVGIPPRYLKKIFEPYYTTKQKGTGLGLSTAYSIIKQHGGTIRVRSGTGKTVFTVLLPALPDGPKKIQTEEASINSQEKILIMDDEENVREVGKGLLESLGYRAETASRGEEAIEKGRRAEESGEPFQAAILDLTITGGMGGIETLKELQKINPEIKIILVSGYSKEMLAEDLNDIHYSALIEKPYGRQKLKEILEEVIKSEV